MGGECSHHCAVPAPTQGENHGIAHVLAVTNVIVYEPIGSDVKIRAGNLHRNLTFAQLEVIEGDEEERTRLRNTSSGEKNFRSKERKGKERSFI